MYCTVKNQQEFLHTIITEKSWNNFIPIV